MGPRKVPAAEQVETSQHFEIALFAHDRSEQRIFHQMTGIRIENRGDCSVARIGETQNGQFRTVRSFGIEWNSGEPQPNRSKGLFELMDACLIKT